MKTLYLCAAGNPEAVRLAQIINQAQPRWDRMVLLDDDPKKHGQSILGVEIVGGFSLLADADPSSSEVCNLVARSATARWAARNKIASYGLPFASLIHPATDETGVEIVGDLIVYQDGMLGALASIAEGAAIFMGGAVGHEAKLGRCCIVGPHAVLNGRVDVGDGVYTGANATILPDITVGAFATIGAGTVVMKNVPPGATVLGVPGKIVFALSPKMLQAREEQLLARAMA